MNESHASPQLKLLTPSEVTAVKKLAGSALSDNKRAAALLAIHQGNTQAQAAESSGLSLGQVKYIVTRFRKLGMKALTAVAESPENADETVLKAAATKTKQKKNKAAKKEKKDKKAKKDKKKDKKDKKDKSNKKKSKKKNKKKK